MSSIARASGGMADAHGSGPCVRKDVGVQLPPCPLDPGGSPGLSPGVDLPPDRGERLRGATVPGVGDPHASPPTPSRGGAARPGLPRPEPSMPAGLDTARRTAARVAAMRARYPGTDTLAARTAV